MYDLVAALLELMEKLRKSSAVGAPVAPFFRFPDLQHPPQLLSYLGERNIAVFSTDIDSREFKIHKPDEVIKSVMSHNWKSAARASSYA